MLTFCPISHCSLWKRGCFLSGSWSPVALITDFSGPQFFLLFIYTFYSIYFRILLKCLQYSLAKWNLKDWNLCRRHRGNIQRERKRAYGMFPELSNPSPGSWSRGTDDRLPSSQYQIHGRRLFSRDKRFWY